MEDAFRLDCIKSPDWLQQALRAVWPAETQVVSGGAYTTIGSSHFIRPAKAGMAAVPGGQHDIIDTLAKAADQALALDLLRQLATDEDSMALAGVAKRHAKTIAALPVQQRHLFIALLYWALSSTDRDEVITAAPELRPLFEDAKAKAKAAADFFK